MKSSIMILFAFLLMTGFLLIACSTNNVQTAQSNLPSTPSGDTTALTSPPQTNPSANTPTTTKAHEISISAVQFAFDPATITVKKGELVRLTLTSKDVAHAIAIPEFGVSTDPVSGGESTTVEFTPTKVGTFQFRCSVPCGPGHRDMTGTITVTE